MFQLIEQIKIISIPFITVAFWTKSDWMILDFENLIKMMPQIWNIYKNISFSLNYKLFY